MDVAEILAEAATIKFREYYKDDPSRKYMEISPDDRGKIVYWLGESDDPILTPLYTITFEDSYGGEGMGSRIYWVYKIVDDVTEEPIYAMVDAPYDSWNGIEWDYSSSIAQVYPKEVVKTVWRNNP